MAEDKNDVLLVQVFTPLTGTLYSELGLELHVPAEEIILDGEDLLQYENKIVEALDTVSGNGRNDLMRYFSGKESIKEKVESALVSVKRSEDSLYGCTTLKLIQPLREEELRELNEFIVGQYADGWGEIVEQMDIEVATGTLNVHFFQSENTLNRQMQTQNLGGQDQVNVKTEISVKRPKMQLLGQDGNIFSILGRASRVLRESGLADQVDDMVNRVTESSDYYQALAIISEYVETELSSSRTEVEKNNKNKPEKGGENR